MHKEIGSAVYHTASWDGDNGLGDTVLFPYTTGLGYSLSI